MRPSAFIPAFVMGSALVWATFDTARTAPVLSTVIPAGGGVLACAGLLGATVYAGHRWPRAEGLVLISSVVLSLVEIIAGLALFHRAISLVLSQMGIWSLFSVIAGWRRGSAADEEG